MCVHVCKGETMGQAGYWEQPAAGDLSACVCAWVQVRSSVSTTAVGLLSRASYVPAA